MENINNTVITDNKLDILRPLICGSDFTGVDCDELTSLFEYGFIYDIYTGDMIYTHSIDVWNDLDVDIRFNVVNVSEEDVTNIFNKNKDTILFSHDITSKEWFEFDIETKINILRTTSDYFNHFEMKLSMNIDDLVNYLINKED